MQDVGTFADWVTAGAALGIKAFFALAVFALFCAACFGIFSLLVYAMGGERDVAKKRRPY